MDSPVAPKSAPLAFEAIETVASGAVDTAASDARRDLWYFVTVLVCFSRAGIDDT
jgi:hypothetical protein